MKGIISFFLLALFCFSGCGMQQREKAVKEKEIALNQKEQELVQREEALRLREEALLSKHRQDSTQQDSTQVLNAKLTGRWEVRMVCRETTCPGSAIGDTKSELWDISYQNGRVVATAIENNLVVRTYSGNFKNNVLELTETVLRSSESPATQMVVQLKPVNETTLEGQREIIRLGDCRIVYDLELRK
ncbi:MAG: hypothetical protein ACO1O1_07610 [Adhaeribacter sp.]